MSKDSFSYITETYSSNCLFEAIKAKIKNPSNVTIYFCKPRITENGNFHDEETELPWYRTFWYKGRIRQFRKNFAKRYSDYRNKRR